MTASYSILLFHVDTFSYHSTLQQLFKEFGEGDSEQQLAFITTKIMQALQTNLEGKSKQYKDPALTQLFLMNNIHYIVRSVRRCVMLTTMDIINWLHTSGNNT